MFELTGYMHFHFGIYCKKKKKKEFTGIQKDWGTSKMQAKDNFNNLLQKIKR